MSETNSFDISRDRRVEHQRASERPADIARRKDVIKLIDEEAKSPRNEDVEQILPMVPSALKVVEPQSVFSSELQTGGQNKFSYPSRKVFSGFAWQTNRKGR